MTEKVSTLFAVLKVHPPHRLIILLFVLMGVGLVVGAPFLFYSYYSDIGIFAYCSLFNMFAFFLLWKMFYGTPRQVTVDGHAATEYFMLSCDTRLFAPKNRMRVSRIFLTHDSIILPYIREPCIRYSDVRLKRRSAAPFIHRVLFRFEFVLEYGRGNRLLFSLLSQKNTRDFLRRMEERGVIVE